MIKYRNMANLLNDPTINYYEILDVSPKATDHEVYQSYVRIKQAYSLRNPELFKNFSLDEIQQLLLYIEEAYATIGNKQSRELYDAHFFKHRPALATQDFLPSLEEPKEEIAEPVKSEIKAAVADVVPAIKPPEGYANTATSIYEIDPTFEALIEGQQFFDGIFLSKVRKYKKVKLEDFSQQTCISIKYLYAIENNNYSALPAQVFVRGYINQYCKMLNLDAEQVIPSFMKLYSNGRE